MRIAILVAFFAGVSFSPVFAAEADLYAVPGVLVDASADSATEARDWALAQGRPAAWRRLFRRLTPASVWERQPVLNDATLRNMVVSFEVANERRSSTRYLGEVTYHFNPADIRNVLRQAAIPYVETQARPVLVIPLSERADAQIIPWRGYNPTTPWAEAWAAPSVAHGLVPILLPAGDAMDQAVLARPDLAQLGWEEFAPLAARYGVSQIVIATASTDALSPAGLSVELTIIGSSGVRTETLAFVGSNIAAAADEAAQRLAEEWKTLAAVDSSRSSRLSADVVFARPTDWPEIRTRLIAVRSITGIDVLGISLHEARLELTFFGRTDQLRVAMAQQNLNFVIEPGGYVLQLANATARRQ